MNTDFHFPVVLVLFRRGSSSAVAGRATAELDQDTEVTLYHFVPLLG